MEQETENYYSKDPDPFDDRHPIRSDPESELGRLLKVLFRKDNFVTKVILQSLSTFLQSTSLLLHIGKDVCIFNKLYARFLPDFCYLMTLKTCSSTITKLYC